MTAVRDLPELVRSRVEPVPGGCLIWTRSRKCGYGEVWVPDLGRRKLVHVYVYEATHGPVPEQMDVGHVCHDQDLDCPGGECVHRACCNPDHLRAQTRSENNLGGRLGAVQRARHASVTHCPQGHPYAPENTYLRHDRPAGGRLCRTCGRERMRRRRAEMHAAFDGIEPATGEILE